MNKYLAEGIGVFLLTLFTLLEHSKGSAGHAPLVAGVLLAALSIALGPLSGAHFNPVVSLALLIQGRINRLQIPYYLLAQFAAAALAAATAAFLMRGMPAFELPAPEAADPVFTIVAEFFGAFAWSAVFVVSTKPGRFPSPAGAGIATGCALLAGMYAFERLGLCFFNPALFVAGATAGLVAWGDFFVYFFGASLGAAAAASAFRDA